MSNTSYLILGSNLGNRVSLIEEALEKIQQQAGAITQRSNYYETEPWGFTHNNSFINMVVEIKTQLSPIELLRTLLIIEEEMGRSRKAGIVDARNIDIDILLYGNVILDEPEIIIPHPRMHLRRFTLIPLAEIAGKIIHPRLNKTTKTLLNECQDTLQVNLFIPK